MGCNSTKKVNPVTRRGEHNRSYNCIKEVRIDASAFVNRRSGKITDEYDIIEKIGSGEFWCINLAVHKSSSQKRAIKTFHKKSMPSDAASRVRFLTEIDTLCNLDHPNIIKFKEAAQDPKNVHLVLELVDGVPLSTYLNKTASEDTLRKIFTQILEALQQCHEQCISHRDIKLENILIDTDHNVKLIDFGFSTYDPDRSSYKLYCGTPSYMAPEIVRNKEFSGPAADIWALGVLFFNALTKTFPFKAPAERDLFKKIARGVFDVPDTVHPQARLMIKRMLQVDPSKRPSAEMILQEQWINIRDEADDEIKDILCGMGYSYGEICSALTDEDSEISILYGYFEAEKRKYCRLYNNYLTVVGSS